jgi:integrase
VPDLILAIANYEQTGDRLTRIALQLLAQTFVRTHELIGAEWREIDLDAALWTIPAKRMKMKTEHIVPLARQTLDFGAPPSAALRYKPLPVARTQFCQDNQQ